MAVLTRLPYCPDLFRYARRKTRTVMVGKVPIGGDNPIRLQSMTTTDTLDVEATAQQALRMAQAGCEIIRITAPTVEDSRALGKIKCRLLQLGVDAPIVADIHFQPLAAMEAAEWVEKVRINPGNFVDNKRFAVKEYTDAEYAAELERIEERFTPLVEKLKRLRRALRIGTNHGSLSDRIMNRYGDSPAGMVESALEFTAICEKNGYRDIIFSMKASNPKVMIEAYRLLAARLDADGRDYPVHLGVTEAGVGEDGRIKSATGIGSLLEDGIGDPIRVSLTEDPELEIPVCAALAGPFNSVPSIVSQVDSFTATDPGTDPFSYARKKTRALSIGPFLTGGPQLVRVFTRVPPDWSAKDILAWLEERLKASQSQDPEVLEFVLDGPAAVERLASLRRDLAAETSRLAFLGRCEAGLKEALSALPSADLICWTTPTASEFPAFLAAVKERGIPTLLEAPSAKEALALDAQCAAAGSRRSFDPRNRHRVLGPRIPSAGGCFDPLAHPPPRPRQTRGTRANLGGLAPDRRPSVRRNRRQRAGGRAPTPPQPDLGLQYPPGRGRSHHENRNSSPAPPAGGPFQPADHYGADQGQDRAPQGVKIAIMGCIVNGPGEMADADFGYVGGAPDRINLYVGKECVEKGIPADQADQALIDLIKSNGSGLRK